MSANNPEWLDDLINKHSAGLSHVFILHGNIYDLQRDEKGKTVSLLDFLRKQVFEQRELIMYYSISTGLQLANQEMDQLFRKAYLNAETVRSDDSGAGQTTQDLANDFKNISNKRSLGQLIGKKPERILPVLERVLLKNDYQEKSNSGGEERTRILKKVLFINYAHNVVPNSQQNAGDPNQRTNVEMIERWSRDLRMRETGNIVILLTPEFSEIAKDLRTANSEICVLKIPKPDDAQRIIQWRVNLTSNGVTAESGITEEILGRITNGLSLSQINEMYAMAKQVKRPISLASVRQKKQEILQLEFGTRIRTKVPLWSFNYFGGKAKLKEEFMEIRKNILRGIYRRVPMGILVPGPPGTGKTFFFECWAYECGFNFVEIQNPRSMWHGQSEEILSSIFSAIDDVTPAIIIEDEADQSEPSRDAFDGSSGVTGRLRQMKFDFCSDPRRRGKVIWIRISNRSDLIDAAYKRKGRTDEVAPFVLPDEDEMRHTFRVIFERHEIPTNIQDFSRFAEMTAQKIYCTGSDIEWMVRESDKMAGKDNVNIVTADYLEKAVASWRLQVDPKDIDRQIILSLMSGSESMLPENFEEKMRVAKERLGNCQLIDSSFQRTTTV